MATQMREIISKLEHMEEDIQFIKNRISDLDLVLSDEDVDAIKQAEEDLKNGKTRRL